MNTAHVPPLIERILDDRSVSVLRDLNESGQVLRSTTSKAIKRRLGQKAGDRLYNLTHWGLAEQIPPSAALHSTALSGIYRITPDGRAALALVEEGR